MGSTSNSLNSYLSKSKQNVALVFETKAFKHTCTARAEIKIRSTSDSLKGQNYAFCLLLLRY